MTLTPPARIYDFEGFARANPRQPAPGDRLNAQFQELIDAIQGIQGVLDKVVRSDGELKSGSIKPESLDPGFKTTLFQEITNDLNEIRSLVHATGEEARSQADAAKAAAREAVSAADFIAQEAQKLRQDAKRALERVEITQKVALDAENRLTDIQSSLLARATVLEQDGASAGAYAVASKEWAEHMPDTLPADTVAVMDVTGAHWSARWWANQASVLFGEMAAFWQGAHHEPPYQTSAGTPLPPGSFYFDLDDNQIYVWNGSSWVPVGVPSKARSLSLDYKATASQTSFVFSVPDLHGESYVVDAASPEPIEVFKAGLRQTLDDGTGLLGDYTYDYAANRIVFLNPVLLDTRVAIDILVKPEDLALGGIFKVDLMDIRLDPGTGLPGYVDGTRTTFKLRKVTDASPVTPTTNNELEVYLDGLYQQPGTDFYVQADTIIFYTAPQPDSAVFIDWLGSGGAGGGGAGGGLDQAAADARYVNLAGDSMEGPLRYQTMSGIVAAGTTQATAAPITADINDIGNVAAGTGVALPPATPGRVVQIVNSGTDTLLVYPALAERIGGLPVNTAVPIPSGQSLTPYCSITGIWRANSSNTGGAIDVLTFIPATEHAAIRANTSTTDLSPYLQQASLTVSNAGGGDLVFPPGTYSFTLFHARSGVTYRGTRGRSILKPLGSVAATAESITNPNVPSDATTRTDHDISFRDLVFDGSLRDGSYLPWLWNTTTNTPVTDPANDPTRNAAYATTGYLLRLCKVQNVNISGCLFRNFRSFTVSIEGCLRVRVENNEFFNTGRDSYTSPALNLSGYGSWRIITGFTKANPCVLTFGEGHSWVAGNTVYLKDFKYLADGGYTISAATATTVTLTGINSTLWRDFVYSAKASGRYIWTMDGEEYTVAHNHFHNLQRHALQYSGRRAGLVHHNHCYKTGECGFFFTSAFDFECADNTISDVKLTDIASCALEINFCGDGLFARNKMSETDIDAVSDVGSVNVDIVDNTITNPVRKGGGLYPYGPFGGALGGTPLPIHLHSYIIRQNALGAPVNFGRTDGNLFIDERAPPFKPKNILLFTKSGVSNAVSELSIRDNDFSRARDMFLISNISQANPGVFTTASAHNLQVGDTVFIANIKGMTQVANNTYTINTVPSGTTFTLSLSGTPLNTTAFTLFEFNQLGVVSTMDPDRLIWYEPGSVVPDHCVVAGNKGHFSFSPVSVQASMASAVTGNQTFKFGFPPRHVFIEAFPAAVATYRMSRTLIARSPMGNQTSQGLGYSHSIDGIGGTTSGYFEYMGSNAIVIVSAAGANLVVAKLGGWTPDGMILNYTTNTLAHRLIMHGVP